MRTYVPKALRRLCKRWVSDECLEAYSRGAFASTDQYADAEEVSTYPAKVDVRLGIIKEFAHVHKYYIGACRELGVPYRLLDISGADWVRVIRDSGCDAFLVRPSTFRSVWKQMYDERLRVISQDMGKVIYPTYDEVWIYESKRRMSYWLESHGIPHPATWVFYNRDEATAFGRTCPLPIVSKTDLGAGAFGVRIFRRRQALLRLIQKCFGKGCVWQEADRRDRQWGSILLQEYLADAAEWRVIRLGRSWFAHQKLKKGDFHSGSNLVGWYTPPPRLLDFARQVTDLGGFTSMDLDIFEMPDGRYLVNELQSLFGSYLPYQMLVDGKPGRFLCDEVTREWRFEGGVFNQNGSCNLRLEVLLERLGKPVPDWPKTE